VYKRSRLQSHAAAVLLFGKADLNTVSALGIALIAGIGGVYRPGLGNREASFRPIRPFVLHLKGDFRSLLHPISLLPAVRHDDGRLQYSIGNDHKAGVFVEILPGKPRKIPSLKVGHLVVIGCHIFFRKHERDASLVQILVAVGFGGSKAGKSDPAAKAAAANGGIIDMVVAVFRGSFILFGVIAAPVFDYIIGSIKMVHGVAAGQCGKSAAVNDSMSRFDIWGHRTLRGRFQMEAAVADHGGKGSGRPSAPFVCHQVKESVVDLGLHMVGNKGAAVEPFFAK